ncbi:hypothetical protein N7509_003171 [Penicillium cosmopolitanum]|uniref:Uncharacterized protein n=1 Tax=Penicillium cosmopolitanum TaxID=1131564 RepID=A0A9X0BB45_9EURO|nr:uncharacterized protein N7509_003171 [Penicillium cosmopolitanum]KAJ5403300.1 hypothetical protein N7509_003171 [Penicillium cosmopolitanum]
MTDQPDSQLEVPINSQGRLVPDLKSHQPTYIEPWKVLCSLFDSAGAARSDRFQEPGHWWAGRGQITGMSSWRWAFSSPFSILKFTGLVPPDSPNDETE